jgi:amidase
MKHALVAALILAFVAPLRAAFPFAEATIDDLQRRMTAGELTARALAQAYLTRIAEVDQAGPKLNAVIEVNPDVLAIAEQLDTERKAGKVRGPLHGIPVLLKDNIATADKMETTAGSLALVGHKPPRDAHLVARLREAGAVILGKTNLSEWANFRGSSSVSGWSGRGGQTRNPYVLDRNPSGSSSGSGAAVAANLCVVAIGTETNGSIMSPSSSCGIVGLKPTVGLVSRTGIIPIAESFDTAGPMTRTVRDAALVLAAIAGADERDPRTQTRPEDAPRDFAGALRPRALQGARIGVIRPVGYWPSVDDVMNASLTALREAGAELIDVEPLPRLAGNAMTEVFRYEMKHGLNAYLATLGPGSPMKTLADLIRFNEQHWSREMPLFGQQHFTAAQAKGPLTEPAYREALEACWRVNRTEGIDATMDKHRLDALVAMTRSAADLTAANDTPEPVFGGKRPSGSSSTPAALAGYPSVTVPAGQIRELPVGISFFGRAWTEAKLLALAADFEARTKARREPKLLKTLESN